MTWRDFQEKYHFRCAEKCCENCKHGEGDYDGDAHCHHPLVEEDRSAGGCDYCVCDLWEKE